VIKFFYPGQYLVTISRTGVAMGTGAFSGAVFSGCSVLWTVSSLGQGPNVMLSNGASTSSQWVVAITVTSANATMSRTGDAGVTHTFSWTTVSFVAENPEVDLDLQAKLVSALEYMGLDIKNLGLRSPSRISAIGPDSETTGTISQGDGPAKTVTTVSTGSLLGTAIDPIFVEPAPVPVPKCRKKRCKHGCMCDLSD